MKDGDPEEPKGDEDAKLGAPGSTVFVLLLLTLVGSCAALVIAVT